MRHILVSGLVLICLAFAVTTANAAGCLQSGSGESLCKMTPLPEPEPPLFVEPDSAEDTLFGRRWYGRLADYAKIYAEPSTSSALLRDAGDGYVFASLLTRLTNDTDEVWYMINYGEYVQEQDITLAEVSEFRGVALSRQSERPFAWVVQEIRPSSRH